MSARHEPRDQASPVGKEREHGGTGPGRVRAQRCLVFGFAVDPQERCFRTGNAKHEDLAVHRDTVVVVRDAALER